MGDILLSNTCHLFSALGKDHTFCSSFSRGWRQRCSHPAALAAAMPGDQTSLHHFLSKKGKCVTLADAFSPLLKSAVPGAHTGQSGSAPYTGIPSANARACFPPWV